MSLFPAYSAGLGESNVDCKVAFEPASCVVSAALEAQLLASDNDDEERDPPPAADPKQPDSANSIAIGSNDYYLDHKFDCGNLRVSTLYYPGRPQYETQKRVAVVGRGSWMGEPPRARRRYFHASAAAGDSADAGADAELALRIKAYRQMLAEQPTDEVLWLRFIDFQERCRDAESALAAAHDAAAALPRSAAVRAATHRLRARTLPHSQRLPLLRADLARCAAPELTTELWLRQLSEVALCGGGAELDAAVAAALHATRAHPAAYPHILYVYGGYLRSAGLWERLVLLLELLTSMNFAPDAFPPPADPSRLRAVEQQLQDTEDKAIASGLPLSTVWGRVERARAGAHWRAGPGGEGDPQRAPLAADVAELLLPAHGPDAQLLLLLHALRLAKVPLLPASGYALAAADAANDAKGDAWWASCGEALLSLARAARRLPAAHAARARCPAEAQRLVANFLDPPHYFTDDTGYLSWVSALWDACLAWTSGAARLALLCWRLRWLHALVLLLDVGEEAGAAEARRIRSEARAALKRWGGESAVPFALFARVEHSSAGAVPATRAALQAMRGALRDADAPVTHRLYVARVVSEVSDGAARPWAGAWSTACAATGRSLPDDAALAAAPPPAITHDALRQCEAQCERLEAALEGEAEASGADGARVLGAMLPGDAEWAAARARLAPAARRQELVNAVRRAAERMREPEAARYWEQSACALALAAAREHRMVLCARTLAPLFPHNALLALATSGGPLWSWEAGTEQEQRLRTAHMHARTHVGALAQAWPALLRAAGGGAGAAARAVAAVGRAARGGAGGALLHAARLEAEARAPHPRPAPALLAALDDYPNHKWLYVRGAAWLAREAGALADALLERELRAHTLLDELTPLPLPLPTTAATDDDTAL